MARAIASGWPRVSARMKKAVGFARRPLRMQRSRNSAQCKQQREELAMSARETEWPLFEVFIRARSGLEHKHVGSVHAADARMAIEHARDVYTRRQEGVSIWVVRSSDVTASDPGDAEALFEPARDKVYRHPTFYAIPEEVKNL